MPRTEYTDIRSTSLNQAHRLPSCLLASFLVSLTPRFRALLILQLGMNATRSNH